MGTARETDQDERDYSIRVCASSRLNDRRLAAVAVAALIAAVSALPSCAQSSSQPTAPGDPPPTPDARVTDRKGPPPLAHAAERPSQKEVVEAEREASRRAYEEFQTNVEAYWGHTPPVLTLRQFLTEVKTSGRLPEKELSQPSITASWSDTGSYPTYGGPSPVLRLARVGGWRARLIQNDSGVFYSLEQELVDGGYDEGQPQPLEAGEENWRRATEALSLLTEVLGPPTVSVLREHEGMFQTTSRIHKHQWDLGDLRITQTFSSIFVLYLGSIAIQDATLDAPYKQLKPLLFLRCTAEGEWSSGDLAQIDQVYGVDFNSDDLLSPETIQIADLTVTDRSLSAEWDRKGEAEQDGAEWRMQYNITIDRVLGTYRDQREFQMYRRTRTLSSLGTCVVVDMTQRKF